MSEDATKPWYSARDISTTLVKGMKVVMAFDDVKARLSLPEIGEICGYDRATVRRLVITLVDLGFLAKVGKSFSLTPKVLSLSGNYLRSHGVGAAVQPVLDRHSVQVGHEISLATLSEGAAIYIAKSHVSGAAVSFGFTVGSRLPVFNTAVGRMLLAVTHLDVVEPLLAVAELPQYTADSLLDAEAVRSEVRKASEQGFALVRNEFEPSVAGLAVPVGRPGQAKTVIGISTAVAELDQPEIRVQCLSALQHCANELDRAWIEGP